MARLMSTGCTERSAAMAGAAVAMMVPSRISMNRVPATSSASGRLNVREPCAARLDAGSGTRTG